MNEQIGELNPQSVNSDSGPVLRGQREHTVWTGVCKSEMGPSVGFTKVTTKWAISLYLQTYVLGYIHTYVHTCIHAYLTGGYARVITDMS